MRYDPDEIFRVHHVYVQHDNIKRPYNICLWNRYQEFIEDHHDYTNLFTDGLKTEVKLGAPVVHSNSETMFKLPKFCFIYTPNAYVIFHAFEIIIQNRIPKSIILSDLLSTIISKKYASFEYHF